MVYATLVQGFQDTLVMKTLERHLKNLDVLRKVSK